MKTRRALLGAAVALGALWGIGPTAAWAHPLLIAPSPEPGLVAASSPSAISLALTEPAVARGSRIRLLGPDGAEVPVSAVRASDGGRTLTARPRARLRSAVYKVRWGALGDDGHIVTGAFDFGVAGAKGAPPPGVETLSSTGGGRGAENAATDSVVRIVSRWLGILSASILFGGFVLLALLRRRRGAGGADGDVAILHTVAPIAWLMVVLATIEGVFAGASSGAGDAFDFGLLTASATGVSDLVRAILVALLSLVLVLAARRRPRARPDLPRRRRGRAADVRAVRACAGVPVVLGAARPGGARARRGAVARRARRAAARDGARQRAPGRRRARLRARRRRGARRRDRHRRAVGRARGRPLVLPALVGLRADRDHQGHPRRDRRAGRGLRVVALARRRGSRAAAAVAARRDRRRRRHSRARHDAVRARAGSRPAAARAARDAVPRPGVRDGAAVERERAGRARAGASGGERRDGRHRARPADARQRARAPRLLGLSRGAGRRAAPHARRAHVVGHGASARRRHLVRHTSRSTVRPRPPCSSRSGFRPRRARRR